MERIVSARSVSTSSEAAEDSSIARSPTTPFWSGWTAWSPGRGRRKRRREILGATLFAPTQGHDESDATRPGRQGIGDRQDRDEHRRQEQWMEAEQPGNGYHGHHVQHLVRYQPAEGAERELYSV